MARTCLPVGLISPGPPGGARTTNDQNGVRPLHVAVIVENVPLCVDTRLRKQVHDLLTAGHLVSVVTQRAEDNCTYRSTPGLQLLEYPPPAQPSGALGYVREYFVSFLWAVALTCRLRLRGHIDVLQLCQPPDVYFPFCRLMRWLGTRVVVDQRDLMPELLAARYERPSQAMLRLLGWLERRTQRVVDHTVCVNDYLRDRIIGAGAAPERVSVVRNGPVLSRVEQVVGDPTLKGPHQFLVCWAGKMGKQDRVDLVVRVAEHVVRDLHRPECGFALLGDGECLDELRALTSRLGLDPWVDFPGWLTEDRVFSYFASADLGLDTSLQVEVSPVKVMEYMAFGLPLVCFDLQESRLIARDAAIFVAPEDTAALARSIVSLLDDAAARSKLGSVGRRRVHEELAWERQTPVYLAAIEPP
jgi:glycosyltransferase involved in cell wall biosynthesis